MRNSVLPSSAVLVIKVTQKINTAGIENIRVKKKARVKASIQLSNSFGATDKQQVLKIALMNAASTQMVKL